MIAFLLIIVALPVFDLLWWWWSDRVIRRLLAGRWRRVARVTLVIFVLSLLAGFASILLARRLGIRTTAPAGPMAVIYLWHLLVAPATALIALLIWLSKGSVNLVRQKSTHPPDASHPSRRDVLKAAAVSLPPLAAFAATGVAVGQLDSLRIRRIDLPLKNLPPALDGITIAQVSDIHVGRFTRARVLPAIADMTNQLRADLVLLTGDLIDFLLADLPDGLDFVRRLDPGSGLAMVEGNHDLFESREEFDRRVIAAGVPLLLNDSRTVRVRGFDVQLLGIRWGGRGPGHRGASYEEHVRATLPIVRRDPGAFPILLAHHPHAFDLAADAGIPLTLAGHTHGGQLMLTPSFGAGSVMYKYWSGLYRRGDSALVVSNGVGNWFPLRINAPAEIVHITLRTF